MAKLVGLANFAFGTFLIGIVAVVFPRRLQSIAAYWVGQGISEKFSSLLDYVQSDAWITNARVVGAGFLVMSFFYSLQRLKAVCSDLA